MNGNIFGMSQPQPQSVQTPTLQQMQEIKRMMQTLDPNQTQEQMLQTLASQNPQFGNLLPLLKTTNGDLRSLVSGLAQLKGVDLNALYEQYKAL